MKPCIFCEILAGRAPASVVYEDANCMAFMDIFPMRPGHVLVVTRRHAQFVHELESHERSALMDAGNRVARAIRASSLRPAALHFSINDGEAAQQTVPHVHLHLLPRYPGDMVRFMATILKKPAQFLLGPTPRAVLDEQAADIRRFLSALPEFSVHGSMIE